MWPKLLDLTPEDCPNILRKLELEAYSSVVSAFRGQGELTKDRRRVLQDLSNILKISIERHKAEVRRATNDQVLATVAKCTSGSLHEHEWQLEGRRIIPLLRRAPPVTSFSSRADQIKEKVTTENATRRAPAKTRTHKGAKDNKGYTQLMPPPPPWKEVIGPNGEMLGRGPPRFSMPIRPRALLEAANALGDVVILPSGMAVRFKQEQQENKRDIASRGPSNAKRRKRGSTSTSSDLNLRGSIEVLPTGMLLPNMTPTWKPPAPKRRRTTKAPPPPSPVAPPPPPPKSSISSSSNVLSETGHGYARPYNQQPDNNKIDATNNYSKNNAQKPVHAPLPPPSVCSPSSTPKTSISTSSSSKPPVTVSPSRVITSRTIQLKENNLRILPKPLTAAHAGSLPLSLPSIPTSGTPVYMVATSGGQNVMRVRATTPTNSHPRLVTLTQQTTPARLTHTRFVTPHSGLNRPPSVIVVQRSSVGGTSTAMSMTTTTAQRIIQTKSGKPVVIVSKPQLAQSQMVSQDQRKEEDKGGNDEINSRKNQSGNVIVLDLSQTDSNRMVSSNNMLSDILHATGIVGGGQQNTNGAAEEKGDKMNNIEEVRDEFSGQSLEENHSEKKQEEPLDKDSKVITKSFAETRPEDKEGEKPIFVANSHNPDSQADPKSDLKTDSVDKDH